MHVEGSGSIHAQVLSCLESTEIDQIYGLATIFGPKRASYQLSSQAMEEVALVGRTVHAF